MQKNEMLKVIGGLGLFALLMWLIVWLVRKED